MPEGGPPEPAGRPLEAVGNGGPRWMAVTRRPARDGGPQNPAYRPTRPPPPPWGSVARRGPFDSCRDETLVASIVVVALVEVVPQAAYVRQILVAVQRCFPGEGEIQRQEIDAAYLF